MLFNIIVALSVVLKVMILVVLLHLFLIHLSETNNILPHLFIFLLQLQLLLTLTLNTNTSYNRFMLNLMLFLL